LLIEAILTSVALKELISALAPTAPGEATPSIVRVMLSQQSRRVLPYWLETTEDLRCPSAQSTMVFAFPARALANAALERPKRLEFLTQDSSFSGEAGIAGPANLGVDGGARSGPPITIESLRRAWPRRLHAAAFLPLPRVKSPDKIRAAKKPRKRHVFKGLIAWLRGGATSETDIR
jgi:hypothetical protein